jgi:hypothetical protein
MIRVKEFLTLMRDIGAKLAVQQAKRQSDNQRIFDSMGATHDISGVFLVDAAGEATLTVNFPVRFIERPCFTFGSELHLDTVPIAGNFPEVNVVISRWVTEGDTAKRYFRGCTFLVKTRGPISQRVWIHWRVSGKAITNPSFNDVSSG